MPAKIIIIDDIGPVHFYKRKSARSIRLSISHQGEIRVSLPMWVPYAAGSSFVRSRKDWIEAERPKQAVLTEGYRLGKAHHVTFQPGSGKSVSTRISGTEARVMLPAGLRWDSDVAQEAVRNVAVRVLKKEARMILPPRLKSLAEKYGFTYSSVAIKQLSGRWGSCSSEKDIVLNCFLMQLPLELIDYVILHELVHTKVMAHGPMFWDEMRLVLPDVDIRRKQIKLHRPVI